jgi:hypothetical protein
MTLSEVDVADLRADAIPEILVTATDTSSNGYVLALDGNGLGNFSAVRSLAGVGRRPNDLGLGDLNLDGLPDVATSSEWDSNAAAIFTDVAGGGPDIVFVEPDNLYTPHGIAIANLNPELDLFPDLAIFDAEGSSVMVAFGDGAGDFLDDPPVFPLDPSGTYWPMPMAGAVGDLTRDGNADIAVVTEGSFGGEALWVLIGDGLGGFTPSRNSPIGQALNYEAVMLADVDGDGFLDVIVGANSAGGGVMVLLNRSPF